MKTVILAGGLGTRLSEETHLKPKPMVEIGQHPILWHIMNIYLHFGHNDFVIALGYKGEIIKDFFVNYRYRVSDLHITGKGDIQYRNKSCENWAVNLCDTGEDSLTGGRLWRLKDVLYKEGTFMLTYGDGVADVNIEQLLKFHRSHGKLATITAVRPPARFGTMVFEDNQVINFAEKPQTGEGWINGGFFVFEPGIFDYLSDEKTILEREPLEQLAKDGELMAFKHAGFWQPMDTVRDKLLLNELWNSTSAPWKVWE